MKENVTNTETSSMILPVLISGVIGAGLALLLTPKSGREMRQDIRRFATSASEQAGEQISNVMEQGQEMYSQGKAAASQALSSPMEELEAEEEAPSSSTASMVASVLLGGIAGAAIALLLAPKPGSEVIEDLKGWASTAYEKGKDLYAQGSTAVKEAMEKGKQAASETAEKLQSAA